MVWLLPLPDFLSPSLLLSLLLSGRARLLSVLLRGLAVMVWLLSLPDLLSPLSPLSLLVRVWLLSMLLWGRLLLPRLAVATSHCRCRLLSDRSWLTLALLTGLLMLSWPLLLPGLLSPLLSLSLLGVDSMGEVEMVMSCVSWG